VLDAFSAVVVEVLLLEPLPEEEELLDPELHPIISKAEKDITAIAEAH